MKSDCRKNNSSLLDSRNKFLLLIFYTLINFTSSISILKPKTITNFLSLKQEIQEPGNNNIIPINNQTSTTTRPSSLPPEILSVLASREMRFHHYMFHQVRNGWLTFDEETREALRAQGWEPPRPAMDAEGNPIHDNLSGEDFLFMHRDMINTVNRLLSQGSYSYGSRIQGWIDIPGPGDTEYPVPPAYSDDETVAEVKSDNYYNERIAVMNTRFKDPEYLRTISLGELGSRLEFEIHNDLHVRFSADPGEQRPDPEPFYDQAQIDTNWDRVEYDFPGDFYSAHVNSVFWKLHGWIDDRIEDWKRANNVSEIQWRGTWMGPMNHQHIANNSTHISHSDSAVAVGSTNNLAISQEENLVLGSSRGGRNRMRRSFVGRERGNLQQNFFDSGFPQDSNNGADFFPSFREF